MRFLVVYLACCVSFGQTLYPPLPGPVTSPFGPRSEAISGSSFHWGLDIAGDTGDPIIASYDGVVTFAGWHAVYGYAVVVTNETVDFLYAHCSQLYVTVGERVSAGQVIALVGSTGVSTGSHLHFEIRIEGQPVDPLLMLRSYAPVTSVQEP
jgi:murein DD-endopeptidase MepM/ murein hydrolase activator NlpD